MAAIATNKKFIGLRSCTVVGDKAIRIDPQGFPVFEDYFSDADASSFESSTINPTINPTPRATRLNVTKPYVPLLPMSPFSSSDSSIHSEKQQSRPASCTRQKNNGRKSSGRAASRSGGNVLLSDDGYYPSSDSVPRHEGVDYLVVQSPRQTTQLLKSEGAAGLQHRYENTGYGRDNRSVHENSHYLREDRRYGQGESRSNRGKSLDRKQNYNDREDSHNDQDISRNYHENSRNNQEKSFNDRRDSRNNREDSRQDRGDSRQDRGDSRQDRGDSRHDRGDSRQDRGDSRQDRGDSRQDRKKSWYDREDGRIEGVESPTKRENYRFRRENSRKYPGESRGDREKSYSDRKNSRSEREEGRIDKGNSCNLRGGSHSDRENPNSDRKHGRKEREERLIDKDNSRNDWGESHYEREERGNPHNDHENSRSEREEQHIARENNRNERKERHIAREDSHNDRGDAHDDRRESRSDQGGRRYDQENSHNYQDDIPHVQGVSPEHIVQMMQNRYRDSKQTYSKQSQFKDQLNRQSPITIGDGEGHRETNFVTMTTTPHVTLNSDQNHDVLIGDGSTLAAVTHRADGGFGSPVYVHVRQNYTINGEPLDGSSRKEHNSKYILSPRTLLSPGRRQQLSANINQQMNVEVSHLKSLTSNRSEFQNSPRKVLSSPTVRQNGPIFDKDPVQLLVSHELGMSERSSSDVHGRNNREYSLEWEREPFNPVDRSHDHRSDGEIERGNRTRSSECSVVAPANETFTIPQRESFIHSKINSVSLLQRNGYESDITPGRQIDNRAQHPQHTVHASSDGQHPQNTVPASSDGQYITSDVSFVNSNASTVSANDHSDTTRFTKAKRGVGKQTNILKNDTFEVEESGGAQIQVTKNGGATVVESYDQGQSNGQMYQEPATQSGRRTFSDRKIKDINFMERNNTMETRSNLSHRASEHLHDSEQTKEIQSTTERSSRAHRKNVETEFYAHGNKNFKGNGNQKGQVNDSHNFLQNKKSDYCQDSGVNSDSDETKSQKSSSNSVDLYNVKRNLTRMLNGVESFNDLNMMNSDQEFHDQFRVDQVERGDRSRRVMKAGLPRSNREEHYCPDGESDLISMARTKQTKESSVTGAAKTRASSIPHSYQETHDYSSGPSHGVLYVKSQDEPQVAQTQSSKRRDKKTTKRNAKKNHALSTRNESLLSEASGEIAYDEIERHEFVFDEPVKPHNQGPRSEVKIDTERGNVGNYDSEAHSLYRTVKESVGKSKINSGELKQSDFSTTVNDKQKRGVTKHRDTQQHRGSPEQQHRGSTEQQHRGSMEQQHRGSTEQQHRGSTEQQHRGSTEQQHRGSPEQQHRGSTEQQHRGSTEQQHRGSTEDCDQNDSPDSVNKEPPSHVPMDMRKKQPVQTFNKDFDNEDDDDDDDIDVVTINVKHRSNVDADNRKEQEHRDTGSRETDSEKDNFVGDDNGKSSESVALGNWVGQQDQSCEGNRGISEVDKKSKQKMNRKAPAHKGSVSACVDNEEVQGVRAGRGEKKTTTIRQYKVDGHVVAEGRESRKGVGRKNKKHQDDISTKGSCHFNGAALVASENKKKDVDPSTGQILQESYNGKEHCEGVFSSTLASTSQRKNHLTAIKAKKQTMQITDEFMQQYASVARDGQKMVSSEPKKLAKGTSGRASKKTDKIGKMSHPQQVDKDQLESRDYVLQQDQFSDSKNKSHSHGSQIDIGGDVLGSISIAENAKQRKYMSPAMIAHTRKRLTYSGGVEEEHAIDNSEIGDGRVQHDSRQESLNMQKQSVQRATPQKHAPQKSTPDKTTLRKPAIKKSTSQKEHSSQAPALQKSRTGPSRGLIGQLMVERESGSDEDEDDVPDAVSPVHSNGVTSDDGDIVSDDSRYNAQSSTQKLSRYSDLSTNTKNTASNPRANQRTTPESVANTISLSEGNPHHSQHIPQSLSLLQARNTPNASKSAKQHKSALKDTTKRDVREQTTSPHLISHTSRKRGGRKAREAPRGHVHEEHDDLNYKHDTTNQPQASSDMGIGTESADDSLRELRDANSPKTDSRGRLDKRTTAKRDESALTRKEKENSGMRHERKRLVVIEDDTDVTSASTPNVPTEVAAAKKSTSKKTNKNVRISEVIPRSTDSGTENEFSEPVVHVYKTTDEPDHNSRLATNDLIFPTKPTPGMRRSKRTRVPRLHNPYEHIQYHTEYIEGQGWVSNIVGVVSLKASPPKKIKLTKAQMKNQPVPADRREKGKTSRKLETRRNNAVNEMVDETVDEMVNEIQPRADIGNPDHSDEVLDKDAGTIECLDTDGSTIIYEECFLFHGAFMYYGERGILNKYTDDEPCIVSHSFTDHGIDSGELLLRGNAIKDVSINHRVRIRLVVLEGDVELLINESSRRLRPRDTACVPSGNFYSIKNLKPLPAILHYFMYPVT